MSKFQQAVLVNVLGGVTVFFIVQALIKSQAFDKLTNLGAAQPQPVFNATQVETTR